MTSALVTLIFTLGLGPAQFGWHIGELNSPQGAITCASRAYDPVTSVLGLPSCIAMDDVMYGGVVSVFSVGGLLGSMVGGRIGERKGRRWACLLAGVPFVVGSLVMAGAGDVVTLAAGRFVCGLASGCAMVVVPIYLGEIAPPESRGTIGTVTQLSVVLGILASMVAGVYLSYEPAWRLILLGGGILGVLQLVLLLRVGESPRWLAAQPDGFLEAKRLLSELRGRTGVGVEAEMRSWREDEEEEGLLGERERDSAPTFLDTIRHHRRAIVATVIVMFANQLTGVNAVIFYGTGILKRLLPDLSAWISVLIQVVNLGVTLVSARLIDSTGRRRLLVWSLTGMVVAHAGLAIGLNGDLPGLSAVAAAGVIAAFGLGAGPIPFLLIGELVPGAAVGHAQSLGLSVNWLLTFVVGFFFPVLQRSFGGSAFYIFSGVCFACLIAVLSKVPETRNKTPLQLWTP
ncbi:Solute carrier 2, facilitated glucose transporter member 4 [Savitreella phatthalungensis]